MTMPNTERQSDQPSHEHRSLMRLGLALAGLLIANMSYAGAFIIIAGIQVAAAGVFWLTMRNK